MKTYEEKGQDREVGGRRVSPEAVPSLEGDRQESNSLGRKQCGCHHPLPSISGKNRLKEIILISMLPKLAYGNFSVIFLALLL